MRLPPVIAFLLAGCTSTPRPEVIDSERGSGMVHVPGGVVRLGRKLTPPVDGFEWAGGTPVQATGPQQPPNPGGTPGGPQGPPDQGGIPGAPPPGQPAGPHGAPGVTPTPGPAAVRGGDLLPAPGKVAPDLGLAPGATGGLHRSAPDPLEPREVEVSPFFIDVTEVTQAQYAAFLTDTGYRPPYVDEPWAEDGWSWDGASAPRATADHPVVLTSWWDAREYCAWAEKRLPTEAEWQLAALGPADDERLFPWGDTYDGARLNHGRMDVPNYDDSDGYERTSPVGAFPEGASRYGLLDAFGNAWEWTADVRVASWDDVLGERHGDRIVNPHTSELGLYAAVRGGAFFFDLRPNPAGERNGFLTELRRKSSGFRCARDG